MLPRTNVLPVIPLRGKVAFPHTAVTFEAGRQKTISAIRRVMGTEDKLVFICTQRDIDKEDVTTDDLYAVGCVARMEQIAQLPGEVVRVTCKGLYRARTRAMREEGGHFVAVTDEIVTVADEGTLTEAHLRMVKSLMRVMSTFEGKLPKELSTEMNLVESAESFVDIAAYTMKIKVEQKQKFLEEAVLTERLFLLERCLSQEIEIAKIEKKIAGDVRVNIDKAQKEYYLREQMKAIRTELGDEREEDEYARKLQEKGLPVDLEEKCLKEVERMKKMQPSSPEYNVIASYLEQVLALPFTEETEDTENLQTCIDILEEDHFGLEKIKERIVEYLAVLKLTGNMNAPILCFVGPPGVGKTSIAKSVARALNRKFVRMSLGGVRDEAEIRGHRRTYIGAMPGRILYGMKNAGSKNPVFLLDEIDKMGKDVQGDPGSALLEALDPEQNATFRDRYLEAPYDLSKVLFITTANSLETIPTALRDRMEIIEVSGYTLEEKTEIAKRYLLPKQLRANGLQARHLEMAEEAYRFVIEGYTREAGVRSLERTIGALCRKVAVKHASNPRTRKMKLTVKEVQKLLGAPKFMLDESEKEAQIGAVQGLAWTSVGGTVLTVEASAMNGKGELKLTGHLGDVMKESAQTALSYLRAHADLYGIEDETFKNTDIHVHVPEGATPKDGPSAGITIAVALLSAFTDKAVRRDIAMTGEITLRGKVLPIGGLKEKALAARRVGIKNVIIPKKNLKDIETFPEVLKKEVRFIPVEDIAEVFSNAFTENVTVGIKRMPARVSERVQDSVRS